MPRVSDGSHILSRAIRGESSHLFQKDQSFIIARVAGLLQEDDCLHPVSAEWNDAQA